jgi:hypothetical protein
LAVATRRVVATADVIFQKLDIDESPEDHRRVLAALAYLRAAAAS